MKYNKHGLFQQETMRCAAEERGVWVAGCRSFSKTSFGRFATFDSLTSKKSFHKDVSVSEFVFPSSVADSGGAQLVLMSKKILGGILLQMVKFSGRYETWSSSYKGGEEAANLAIF